MKVIKVTGECINLNNDFTEIKTVLSAGIGELIEYFFKRKALSENFDVVAIKKICYSTYTANETVILGTYENEYRARQVCSELVNAWANNKNIFTMPQR